MSRALLLLLAAAGAARAADTPDTKPRCFGNASGELNGMLHVTRPISIPAGKFLYVYEFALGMCNRADLKGIKATVCDSGAWYDPAPEIHFTNDGIVIFREAPAQKATLWLEVYCQPWPDAAGAARGGRPQCPNCGK